MTPRSGNMDFAHIRHLDIYLCAVQIWRAAPRSRLLWKNNKTKFFSSIFSFRGSFLFISLLSFSLVSLIVMSSNGERATRGLFDITHRSLVIAFVDFLTDGRHDRWINHGPILSFLFSFIVYYSVLFKNLYLFPSWRYYLFYQFKLAAVLCDVSTTLARKRPKDKR